MKEYILDTNFIIRLLTEDDDKSFQQSLSLFRDIYEEKSIGYISLLVVNEVIWVMENYYGSSKREYIPPFLEMLGLKNMRSLDIGKRFLLKTLDYYFEEKLDFTDIYLLAQHEVTNIAIVTYDKKLNKLQKSR